MEPFDPMGGGEDKHPFTSPPDPAATEPEETPR
jgi:hypothetical protein